MDGLEKSTGKPERDDSHSREDRGPPGAAPTGPLTVDRADLDWAAARGLLPASQVTRLWEGLAGRCPEARRGEGLHVAYLLGGLVVLVGLAYLLVMAVKNFGHLGGLALSLLYGGGFWFAATRLDGDEENHVPLTVMATLSVLCVPFAVHFAVHLLGLQPLHSAYPSWQQRAIARAWMDGSIYWSGAVAALLAARRFRLGPLSGLATGFALAALNTWAPSFLGKYSLKWVQICRLNMGLGFLAMLGGVWLDRRGHADHAGWVHALGVPFFWFGLTFQGGGNEFTRFLYFLVNLGLLLAAVLLRRRLFAAAGGMGSFLYLAYLCWKTFRGSMLFPLALSTLGLVTIGLTLWVQRHQDEVEAAVADLMP